MKEILNQIIGRFLWPLVKGSSILVFNEEKGKVRKAYHPRISIRLLNLLAFQRWTCRYERKVGLQIACYRRKIAHYVLGCSNEKCKVAPCLGIEWYHGQLALVTELIEGRQPNRLEIIPVSKKITTLFLRAGLPTWSIYCFNPRFHTNFIINLDQVPVIVDLESHVLNISVPLKELWNNFLMSNFPPLDDIHFPKLWRFFQQEAGTLPKTEREGFKICIEECQRLTKGQKSEEIRIWSRLLDIFRCHSVMEGGND